MKNSFAKTGSWKLFCGVAASSILLFLPIAFLGLDLEDRGFHLYEQLQAFNKFGTPSKMTILTNFLGGAWLYLLGNKFLYFWSICGGLLLAGVNFGFAALIVKEIFRDISAKKIWLFSIAALICSIYAQGFFAIAYYTVPLLATELFLLFYLKARHSENKTKVIIYFLCAGFFAGIAPFLRLPTIYLIFVPLVYEFLIAFYKAERRFSVIYFYLAAITTLIVCYWGLAQYSKNFSEYAISVNGLNGRTLIELVKMPIKYCILCFWAIYPAIILLFLLMFIKKTRLLQHNLIIAACFAALFISGSIYFCWAYSKDGWYFGIFPLAYYRKIWETLPFALILALLIPPKITQTDSAFLQFPYTEKNLQIVMICCVFIAFMFGTNTGLIKICYGFPIILPIGFIILEQYFGSMKKTFVSILLAGLFTSLFFTPSAAYCDANRLRCKVMPDSRQLAWVFSEQTKVQTVDKIVSEIKKHSKPNEEILMWGVDYTILVAADCRSWCNMGYRRPHIAQPVFLRYCEKKNLPQIALANKTDANFKNFGEAFMKKYYDIVFEESTYTIWKKKDL